MKLSKITTFRIGGNAKNFFEISDLMALRKAVKFAKNHNKKILVIGEGSNMLISDDPIERVVLRINYSDITKTKSGDSVTVKVGAGMNWDKFVAWCVSKNYQGIECLSYIPGLVGASPVQNIGAYGQELSDSFVELEAYDVTYEKLVKFDKKSINFGYRNSIFKNPENDGRYIIFTVTFRLKINGKPCVEYKSLKDYLDQKAISDPTLKDVRNAVIDIRKTKLEDPNILANAGSFFKNPIISKDKLIDLKSKYVDLPSYEFENNYKIPAGWLIEKVGWRGKRYKDVGVSDKHALVLVNYGEGDAKQIRELAQKIIDDVRDKFGVELEQEVRNY